MESLHLRNVFKNHLECCRICFKPFTKTQKLEITEDIEIRFLTITQMNLKKSENNMYSKFICSNCDKELKQHEEYKKNITLMQEKLYEYYPDNERFELKTEFLQIDIKQENDDEFPDFGNAGNDLGLNDNLEIPQDSTGENQEAKEVSGSARLKRKKGSGKEVQQLKQRRVCPDCGHHVMDLSRHWRRSHSKIINFLCDLCGYGALMKHRIINHMRNKHFPKENRVKFQCSVCDFQTVNRSYLMIHEKSHSVQPNEFQCHCGKSFLSKHILQQHILMVHERAFKFKCSYCPKAYPSKKAQKEHILTQHTKKDIRDKICDICSRAFITDMQLQAHLKEVHTEGPIPCEVEGCPKRFHKVSKLKRHMKMHTQEKNYQCDQCDRCYSHASHLYRHQEAVHLGLVFPCEVPGCQTNFRRRDNYRVHLMKSHKDVHPAFIEELMKKSTKPIVLQ